MADSPGREGPERPERPARGRVRALLESLLKLADSSERTAAAFALGVAIGFSPFLGFQTILSLVLAFALGLNRVAVFAGTWVNLPWFMGPYYAAATALGAWLTGTPMPPNFLGQLQGIWKLSGWTAQLEATAALLEPLLVPYLLGSMAGAVLAGLLAYRLTFAFISSRRRERPATGISTPDLRRTPDNDPPSTQ
jgi:uncharacterized protein (DUF2062 family)